MSAATAVHVWDVDSNKSVSGENSRERGRGYVSKSRSILKELVFSNTYTHCATHRKLNFYPSSILKQLYISLEFYPEK